MVRELIALALLVACNSTQARTIDNPAPVPTGDTGDDAPAFRVDVAPPAACARGAACEARLVVTAQGGFKVNEEYPHKFVADAGSALAFDGTGTFAKQSTKTGTLTIKFRADTAGTAKVSGTFKLSVCTEDVCKIEAPKIAFDVPVN